MGSDTRYICHCYDIMAKLSASHNDIIIVINFSLTFNEDKHGNLGVRGIRDYYILGSVDIKQMVKNICT